MRRWTAYSSGSRGTAGAVAHPVREQVRRHARVADDRRVRAAVAEALHGHRVQHHVVETVVGAPAEVEQRAEQELATVGAEQQVVHERPRIEPVARRDRRHALLGRRLVLQLVAEREEVARTAHPGCGRGWSTPGCVSRASARIAARTSASAQPFDPLRRAAGRRARRRSGAYLNGFMPRLVTEEHAEAPVGHLRARGSRPPRSRRCTASNHGAPPVGVDVALHHEERDARCVSSPRGRSSTGARSPSRPRGRRPRSRRSRWARPGTRRARRRPSPASSASSSSIAANVPGTGSPCTLRWPWRAPGREAERTGRRSTRAGSPRIAVDVVGGRVARAPRSPIT